MKTSENPTTKLRELKKIWALLLSAVGSSIPGPHMLTRYTGTIGNTHGDRKDNSPPLKATTSDIFSVTIIYSIIYVVKISTDTEDSLSQHRFLLSTRYSAHSAW